MRHVDPALMSDVTLKRRVLKFVLRDFLEVRAEFLAQGEHDYKGHQIRRRVNEMQDPDLSWLLSRDSDDDAESCRTYQSSHSEENQELHVVGKFKLTKLMYTYSNFCYRLACVSLKHFSILLPM